jgi:hypothetical protein
MSDRIDEIESRLRELGPKQAADGGSTAEPAAEPPVRESGPPPPRPATPPDKGRGLRAGLPLQRSSLNPPRIHLSRAQGRRPCPS